MRVVVGAFLLSTLALAMATVVMGLRYGWGPTLDTLWIGALMAYGMGAFLALAVWAMIRWID